MQSIFDNVVAGAILLGIGGAATWCVAVYRQFRAMRVELRLGLGLLLEHDGRIEALERIHDTGEP
jgi:hypothetical protein